MESGTFSVICCASRTRGSTCQYLMHTLHWVRRRRRRDRRELRSCWVGPWLSAERRLKFGYYDRLMAELRMEDQQSFFNFLRMPPQMFDELLNRVGPRCHKNGHPLEESTGTRPETCYHYTALSIWWQVSNPVRGAVFIRTGWTQWERGKRVLSTWWDLIGRSKNVVRAHWTWCVSPPGDGRVLVYRNKT